MYKIDEKRKFCEKNSKIQQFVAILTMLMKQQSKHERTLKKRPLGAPKSFRKLFYMQNKSVNLAMSKRRIEKRELKHHPVLIDSLAYYNTF